MTTQNTLKRKTPLTPAGFKHTIPASEHPQAHVLDREATRIGQHYWQAY